MSFDRKIDQICEHFVRDEAVFVSPDRVTVRPIRPISSGLSVSMRFNGEGLVPPTGLPLAAQAKGSIQEPYTIVAGVSDTLVVAVNGRAEQTITLPAGAGFTAEQVARALSVRINGARAEVSRRRQVSIRTDLEGPKARFQLKDGSNLAGVLGLLPGRVWQGRYGVPGWSLIRDPNTLSDRPTRFLVFDEELPGLQDFVEISYTTVRQECRRCGGLGVENDWRYNVRGDVVEVRDEALLIQEVLKLFYTLQGSNPFHSWYGTNILTTVGQKLSAAGLIQSFIVSDLQEAFRRWQQVKKQQEQDVGQVLSDEEYPFRLLSVSLEQSDKDPTIIFVNSTIQSRSAKPIQLSRGVRLPEPADLLGSTAQAGIFRQSTRGFTLSG